MVSLLQTQPQQHRRDRRPRRPWALRGALALALIAQLFAGIVCRAGAIHPTDCTSTERAPQFAGFLDEAFERDMARHPIRASRIGIKTYEDRWDDIGERAWHLEAQAARDDLKALHRFDPHCLAPADQLNYRLFEQKEQHTLARVSWHHTEYLVTQMDGIPRSIPNTLIGSHVIGDLRDAEAYIARLRGVAPLIAKLLSALRAQERAGVRPPGFVYDLVIEQVENLLHGHPLDESADEQVLLADFRAKLDRQIFEPAVRSDLVARATYALQNGFAAGYRQLLSHLRQAREGATDDAGVWKLPLGDAYYRYALQNATTLPLDPTELHAYGLREVSRWQAELLKLAPALRLCPSLAEMLAQIRADPRFFYEDGAAGRAHYLADAAALLAEVKGRQTEVLTRPPRADIELRPVEPWREKSAARASYQNPAQDGSRPAIFYVDLYDMAAAPRYQLAATLYHEAIPGHHIETAVAYELPGLPRFRKFALVPAFSEGWSLYCEQLADELGWYRDPEQELGRVAMALMRAARLVVDTGLHARRWSRDAAVQYLDTNTTGTHFDNQREIDRYIADPGQATAYYVGMRQILELREAAHHQLGEQFDLRRFHDAVLGNGPVPMPVLRDEVGRWLARQRPR
jgi:uncharacterized protein (DUF885 family)